MEHSIEELQEIVNEHLYRIIEITDAPFDIEVKDVNHTPHPYKIGFAHESYAQRENNGIIDTKVLNTVPCAEEGCSSPYADHRYNRIYEVKLNRDVHSDVLVSVLKAFMEIPELREEIQEMSLLQNGHKLITRDEFSKTEEKNDGETSRES